MVSRLTDATDESALRHGFTLEHPLHSQSDHPQRRRSQRTNRRRRAEGEARECHREGVAVTELINCRKQNGRLRRMTKREIPVSRRGGRYFFRVLFLMSHACVI